VYFYFPFPLFYFHWVLWIYNSKHIFMYCVPNFVDLFCLLLLFLSLPLCMVGTLRAGLRRSQEQTSTTPPQKPKDSEDPFFLGCYAGQWSQCTPWKIITSQHSIISQKTWILSSFFTVADLEDNLLLTKLDADWIWAVLVTFKWRTCYISVCSLVPECSLTT